MFQSNWLLKLMALTLLHHHIKFAGSMFIEILASKFLVVMGTYSFKLRSFLCPHFLAKLLMLVIW